MDKEDSVDVDKCSKMEMEEELVTDSSSVDKEDEGQASGASGEDQESQASSSDSSSSADGDEEEEEPVSDSSSEDIEGEGQASSSSGDEGSSSDSSSSDTDDSDGEGSGSASEDVLRRKNKKLKTTVGKLEASLSRANARAASLEQENSRLHGDLELFRKWEVEVRKMEEQRNKKLLQKKELRSWSKEVQNWEGLVEGLTRSMEEINEKWQGREREIVELTKKLEKLRGAGKVPEEAVVETTPKAGRKDAILIFPEEVWKTILGHLTDPQDLWNSTNTCQLFNTILHQWKTSWMFELTFPHLFRHLPKDKILECRLVSKGWNQVVDQFFEGHPSLRPTDPEGDEQVDRRLLPFVNPLVEKGFDKVNVVSFSPDSGPGIPSVPGRIIGRALMLDIKLNPSDLEGGGLNNARIFDNVETFLLTYGKDIWYLTVIFNFGDNPADSAKERLLRFLTGDFKPLVANLRKLCVRISPPQRIDPQDIAREMAFTASSWPKDLETIELTEGHSRLFLMALLGGSMLTSGRSQLRQLHLLAPQWDDVLSVREWPSLTELHLKLLSVETLALLVEDKDKFPHLRLLGLDLAFSYESRLNGSLDPVMDTVTRLSSGTRLRTLRLRVDIRGRLFQAMKSDLCLPPTLTTVELEVDDFDLSQWSSYAFLLRFPFVENLHHFCRRAGDRDELLRSEIGLLPDSELEKRGRRRQEERFEFVEVNKYLFRKQMYKSNIWKLLPRLKLFSFQRDVYTRAVYEQFME